jgi:F-type H+-transporting ATPase subunit epsilon
MTTVPLDIVTPDRKVFGDDVQMVIVRGELGDLGILPGHAPLVTSLKVSAARIKMEDGSEQMVALSGGFMEVKPDKITILAEAAELPEEIDINRAERARERAERRLADARQDETDFRRAELALMRAMNRLDVVKQAKERK